MVYRGAPSDNAVTATRTVTLHDDDELVTANGSDTGTTVDESGTFYAPDASPGTNVYNVIRVEVVVWRM